MSGLEVTLLRPQWLLVLPVLAAFGWALRQRHGALGDWGRAADSDLLAALGRLGHVDDRGTERPLALVMSAAFLVALALAGPAVERRDTPSFRNLDGVLLLVDASTSMTGSESWHEVLTMGRFGISVLGSRPGGIIVFGGDAYVASDMTLDHLQLGQSLSLIDADTMPDPGSRPERAIGLAAEMLHSADIIAGDVLVLTDGAGLGPASLLAAERVAALGARVSFVAADAPSPAMEAHAAIGGGRVFGLRDVDPLVRFLGEDARTRLERQDYPLLFWRDIGRYLLLLAAAPVVLLFRRGPA